MTTAFLKMLLAVTGVAAASTAAADVRTTNRGATSVPAHHTWTGFYAGVNGGYAWKDRDSAFTGNDILSQGFFVPNNGTPIPNAAWDTNGAFAGVQIGYNWIIQPRWLVGLEADFQFANITGEGTARHVSVTFPSTGRVAENIEWFGTVRARFGYLVRDDLLLFGTGGFAYGRVQQSADWTWGGSTIAFSFGPGTPGVVCVSGTPCYAGAAQGIETGWTIGGGIEWLVWRNISLKTEYLYVNFGSRAVTIVGSIIPSANHLQSSASVGGDLDFHAVRAGLNFKF